jgi:hypothetical protein
MKKLYLILFLLLTSHFILNAQVDSLSYIQEEEVPLGKNNLDVQPLFSLGTGMSAYFGDLHRFKGTNPIDGHWGFNVGLGARLTDYLDVKFNFSHSWLSFHENSKESNLNFKSRIITTGFIFTYNFNNLFNDCICYTSFSTIKE